MTTRKLNPGQGSLFEEDYLLRTLGTLAYKPEVALTELVANAWDAGAAEVRVDIPERSGDSLTIIDDGSGMTPELFKQRWMTLGYDRMRHQGAEAEFPPERKEWKRRAYGHNGIGRHGLLCFGHRYQIETWRDGVGGRFQVGTTFGQHPFRIESEEPLKRRGHGTRLSVKVEKHLPTPTRILDILAARFLHDPRFQVRVNGKSVPLWEHSGLLEERTIIVNTKVKLKAFFVDTTASGRTTQYQGIAFWVGGRLVGDPSWILGKESVLDGRTRLAKRYTAIITTDDLHGEVLPDWGGFRESDLSQAVFDATKQYVVEVMGRLSTERREETRNGLVREHATQIKQLQPLARLEVAEFIDAFTEAVPQATSEVASAAILAVINLEKSRHAKSLLEKLAKLSDDDIGGLDRLLSEWTVRDALTVLDELDNRLAVLEAISRLSSDPAVDELHSLHPLVTQARWLFGPEFDSPEYSANVTLSTTMRQLLKKRLSDTTFLNASRRPDIIVLSDSTLSATATENMEDEGLATITNILIVELKRGGSTLGRDEVNQATGYVEDLLRSGNIDGSPTIRAFVVGHRISDKIERLRKVGEQERGHIRVAAYSQLVRTGEKRLFALRERLADRYGKVANDDLLSQAIEGKSQFELLREP